MALDKKQAISLIAVSTLLFSALAGMRFVSFASANYVPWVWHNSGIFIHSDGTIEPPNSPIQRWGNVYKFTGDVFAGIAIQKNDTVLDGNGFRLFGSYYGTGVLLENVSNVVVQNVNVQYFGNGIYLDRSNSSTIKGSIVAGSGIKITQSSCSNQISGNSVSGDISVDFSDDNTIAGNNASSVSIAWSTNVTIANNRISDAKRVDAQLIYGNYTEGIYVDNSANSSIIANTVERKGVGIDIWQSTNLNFRGNTLDDNQLGFKLWGADLQHNLHNIDTTNTVNGKPVYFLINKTDYQVPTNAGWIAAVNSKNITVKNWVSTPNWDGVLFVDTQSLRIVNSNFTGNFNAIRFDRVSNCTVTQNWISSNEYAALYFEDAVNNSVIENEVVDNYCLFNIWHGSANNTLHHNDFVGNRTGSIGKDFRNQWDNGAEGNYWSSFMGVDLNHDGISDTAYVIDSYSGETDRYPLMAPQKNGTASHQTQTFESLVLAMPQEYLNYTISNVNGTFWAKIDGVYPMHMGSGFGDALPMVYPIPPSTTNIHVRLDGAELSWSNYSDVDPAALHRTDIGNWQMIYCHINPASSDFLLEIHYEHPIQMINGSNTFLYDLNISPYLSPSSVISTAHFNIQLPANSSGVDVFTTGTSGGAWSPVNYTSTTNVIGELVSFNIVSEYGKPLLGDVAFVLKGPAVPEFPAWIILPLLGLAALATAVFVGKGYAKNFGHRS